MHRVATTIAVAAAFLTLGASSRSAIQSPQGHTYDFGVFIHEIVKSNGQKTANDFGTAGVMTFNTAPAFLYTEGNFVTNAPGTWSESAQHVAKAEVDHTTLETALANTQGGTWHVKKFSFSAIKSDAAAIVGKNLAKYRVDDSGTITSFTDKGSFGGFGE